MKRNQPPREERRRLLAELNLVDEPKRLAVRRRSCASYFGSILVLIVVAAICAAGIR